MKKKIFLLIIVLFSFFVVLSTNNSARAASAQTNISTNTILTKGYNLYKNGEFDPTSTIDNSIFTQSSKTTILKNLTEVTAEKTTNSIESYSSISEFAKANQDRISNSLDVNVVVPTEAGLLPISYSSKLSTEVVDNINNSNVNYVYALNYEYSKSKRSITNIENFYSLDNYFNSNYIKLLNIVLDGQKSSQQRKEAAFTIFDTYGTHIITSVNYGKKFDLYYQLGVFNTSNNTATKIDFQNAVTAGLNSLSASNNIEVSVQNSVKKSGEIKSTSLSCLAYGGQSNYLMFNDLASAKNGMTQWSNSNVNVECILNKNSLLPISYFVPATMGGGSTGKGAANRVINDYLKVYYETVQNGFDTMYGYKMYKSSDLSRKITTNVHTSEFLVNNYYFSDSTPDKLNLEKIAGINLKKYCYDNPSYAPKSIQIIIYFKCKENQDCYQDFCIEIAGKRYKLDNSYDLGSGTQKTYTSGSVTFDTISYNEFVNANYEFSVLYAFDSWKSSNKRSFYLKDVKAEITFL